MELEREYCCTSCDDSITYESHLAFKGKCYECHMELVYGVIVNNNVHIIGAPETKKVDELTRTFGG